MVEPDRYFARHLIEDEQGRGWLDYRLATGGAAEIVNIEVDAAWRGRGVGTKLFERMLSELPPEVCVVYAFTARGNVPAQAWYRKQGFEMTLIPRFYAARGEDAFCCVRRVQGQCFVLASPSGSRGCENTGS